MLVTVNRCAVRQREIDVGSMDATEQCTIIGQIAPTDRERDIDGSLIEVMVAIMLVLYTPSITADDTVKSLYGIDDGSSSLTQEAGEAMIAIIKDGRIVSDFIADDLRHATQKAYRLTFDTPEQMTRFLIENQNSDVMQISETDPAENTVVILTDDQYINQIIDVLSAYSVSAFEHQKETLEDYFMKYYKEDKNFGGVFQK